MQDCRLPRGTEGVITPVGCYAAMSVIVYRHFGTAYRSHLQRSRIFLLARNMGPTGYPETSVSYQHTLRNNSEGRGPQEKTIFLTDVGIIIVEGNNVLSGRIKC
jgi:hypothetical protein